MTQGVYGDAIKCYNIGMSKSKKIAIKLQSEVCFFTIKPLLVELKKKYDVFLIVDRRVNEKDGNDKIASETARLVEGEGMKAWDIPECANKKFDLCLSPYYDDRIKAKCYLKYEYGTLNIKPNLTYFPESMELFQGFLCQSTVTEALLSVYGKTFAVDNLRFFGKKKKISKAGTKVLFAPTFNDDYNTRDLSRILRSLKKNGYYVIVKGHHGTQYLDINKEKKDVLVELADEYYGSDASLSELILKADVCLFGNSSAIGEALYAGVPCAIFAHDLDYFKLGDIHTTQYHLAKERGVPYTNNPDRVNEIVKQALTKSEIDNQRQLSKEIFPDRFRTGVKGYLDAINYFMEDSIAKDYIRLHNFAVEERKKKLIQKESEKEEIINELNKIKAELSAANEWIDDAKKKKLYKVADKLYKIEGKILYGKN